MKPSGTIAVVALLLISTLTIGLVIGGENESPILYDEVSDDELTQNSVDYLIVLAKSEWEDAIVPFAEFKESQGRGVKTITLEGYPYIQCSGNLDSTTGNVNFNVIYDEIQGVWLDAGQPAEFYTLLVGAAEHLSPYFAGYVDDLMYDVTWRMWRDHEYWDLDGNSNTFQNMVGRWPVYNETEIEWLTQRTIAYTNTWGEWTEDIRVWGTFESDMNYVRDRLEDIYPDYTISYLRGGSAVYDEVTQQFFEDGHSLYFYRGHGGPYVWQGGDYTTKDYYERGLEYPENYPDARQGLMLSIACSTGHLYNCTTHTTFGDPWGIIGDGSYRNIGEQWVLNRNGGVGFLGACRFMTSGMNSDLTTALLNGLEDGILKFGELALISKQLTPQYNLLGDPDTDIVFEGKAPGSLTVNNYDENSQPMEADVYIYQDGQLQGSGTGTQLEFELREGNYDVRSTADYYRDEWVYDVEIEAGENTDLDIYLERTEHDVGIEDVQWYFPATSGSVDVTVRNYGTSDANDVDVRVLMSQGEGGHYTLYNTNFSDSDGGFTHGGTNDNWEWGWPEQTAPRSGTNVWATGLDDSQPRDQNSYLEMPSIELPEDEYHVLEFYHWYDFHGGYSSDFGDDAGRVVISTDGGSSWEPIAPVGGYPDVTSSGNPWGGGIPCYAGQSISWVKASFNISDHAGDEVIIRYLANSDGSWRYPGWFIDEVSIESYAPIVYEEFYDNTQTIPLILSGESEVASFSPTMPESGNYTLEVEVIYTLDEKPDNNHYEELVYVEEGEAPGVPPGITISRPQGGEEFTPGTYEDITWTTVDGDDPVESIDLWYSTDGGGSWKTIASEVGDTGVHSWYVPNDVTTEGKVRARARDTLGRTGQDVSSGHFEIVAIAPVPPAPPMGLAVEHYGTSGTHDLFTEDFTGVSGIPDGWTEVPTGRWETVDDNRAGGTAPELRFARSPYTTNTFRVYTPAIDTTGYAELELSFAHFMDDSGSRYSIRVETSSDGEDWDTIWSLSPPGNVGPETVTIDFSDNVGSETLHIAWTLDGNTFDVGFYRWNIDDIVLTGEGGEGTEHNLLTWDASIDDPTGVSQYNIYRSEHSDGTYELIDSVGADGSTDYSYIDLNKGTADETLWWYIVRAESAEGLEEENNDAVREPGPTETFDIPLIAGGAADGWNFVSFNLIPLTSSLETILDDIDGDYDRVMYYDASTGQWSSYMPGRADRYNNLQSWNRNMGVWIRATSSITLTIEGSLPVSTDISLYPGWNMVGLPSIESGNHGLPVEVNIIGFFDSLASNYISYDHDPNTFTFQPGKAYWIHNPTDTTLSWEVTYL